MLRVFGLIGLFTAVTACQQQPVGVEPTIPIPTVTTIASVVESTAATPTTPSNRADDRCFDPDPPLVDDGFLGRFDSQDSDSRALAGFKWSETGECAALTLSFRSEAGAPAVDPPEFRAEYLRHTAVVRLELGSGIGESAVSEQALDTGLLETAFVAFDPAADALVADIHLAAGATVRVRPVSSPARIIVEIESDGKAAAGTATVGEAVVLFAPESSQPPLLVQGYGRSGLEVSSSFEAGSRVLDDTIILGPSPTRWTIFEWTIRDFQPGPVVISVGDAAPVEFISR